jgi:hypothetical protein
MTDEQSALATVVQELAAMEESVRIMTPSIVAAAQRAGLDDSTIILLQEHGRRQSRAAIRRWASTPLSELLVPAEDAHDAAPSPAHATERG